MAMGLEWASWSPGPWQGSGADRVWAGKSLFLRGTSSPPPAGPWCQLECHHNVNVVFAWLYLGVGITCLVVVLGL